ncbi:uncharacterized protein [Centroberyx affinis]|uniref:uncharacterized protein isoform X1 n=1 Tax=Centroberyx affinis TaxID=166261 RepID=UPI003A5BFA9B
MYLKTLLFAGILLTPVFACGQKKLLCSSENVEIWYSYSGRIYYLSASSALCLNGMTTLTVTYTVIPSFQFRHVSLKASIWYNKRHWFEKTMNDFYCPDVKLCNVLKGETLHDTITQPFSPHMMPKGIYEVFIEVINLDSIMEEKAQLNVTTVIR